MDVFKNTENGYSQCKWYFTVKIQAEEIASKVSINWVSFWFSGRLWKFCINVSRLSARWSCAFGRARIRSAPIVSAFFIKYSFLNSFVRTSTFSMFNWSWIMKHVKQRKTQLLLKTRMEKCLVIMRKNYFLRTIFSEYF